MRMSFKKLRLVGLGLAAVLLAGLVGEAVAEHRDARNYPPPGRLVDVGGHSLHLYCTGKGAPTVVLEAGMGGWSNDWMRVQPGLAEVTTVCSYDRAGFGWSEPSGQPLTAASLTAELHTLLQRAEVPGPFVLVGHSLGGLLVQHYAATYPAETAGMVLVDSTHERQLRLIAELTGNDPAPDNTLQYTGLMLSPFGITRLVMPYIDDPTILPEADAVKRAFKVKPAALWAEIGERKALSALLDEVAASPVQLGDIPLVVQSRDQFSLPEEREFWVGLQQELAARSARGKQVTIGHSGHYIHYDQPEAVVGAVKDVVSQVRTGSAGAR